MKAASCLAFVGGGVAWYVVRQNMLTAAESALPRVHPITRTVSREQDKTGLTLTLYQYQSCPFCTKVRVLLDTYGFSYSVVEVNSVMRKELKWSEYRKVPILCIRLPDGQEIQLNDSCVIVSILESFCVSTDLGLEKIKSYYPGVKSDDGKMEYPNKYFIMFGDAKPDRAQSALKEEREWRRWTDEFLIHAISPNIYRKPSEALDAFFWYDQWGGWEECFTPGERRVIIYMGTVVMYVLGKWLKYKHELKDDVRESMYDLVNQWLKALGKRKFMGGERPNLADLSVYGALHSFHGLETFDDVMRNTKLLRWYKNMNQAASSGLCSQKLELLNKEAAEYEYVDE